jgi:hypothetical protein
MNTRVFLIDGTRSMLLPHQSFSIFAQSMQLTLGDVPTSDNNMYDSMFISFQFHLVFSFFLVF